VRRTLAALALALACPAAAAAHVTISPPFVEDGVETEIVFTTPNERPPHATVGIRATAPSGIAVVAATAPAGWRVLVDGSTVTWSGGRLEGRESARFPVRVRARVRAGTYTFAAAQTYEDSAVVRWQAGLTVLPATGTAAPAQHPWGAIAAGLAGIVVIAASLVGVRLVRGRSLQEK
jgi:uncharacterized protein YcnI